MIIAHCMPSWSAVAHYKLGSSLLFIGNAVLALSPPFSSRTHTRRTSFNPSWTFLIFDSCPFKLRYRTFYRAMPLKRSVPRIRNRIRDRVPHQRPVSSHAAIYVTTQGKQKLHSGILRRNVRMLVGYRTRKLRTRRIRANRQDYPQLSSRLRYIPGCGAL